MNLPWATSWTAAFLLITQPLAALAQGSQNPPSDPRYWGPGPWHTMWGGGWGLGWIFPLLMMIFFVALCILMMRGFGMHGPHRDTTASALQLLNERFARGEISKEEFEEKRSMLVRRA